MKQNDRAASDDANEVIISFMSHQMNEKFADAIETFILRNVRC